MRVDSKDGSVKDWGGGKEGRGATAREASVKGGLNVQQSREDLLVASLFRKKGIETEVKAIC